MPLLKRKAFQKSTASEYLRDDDEVFHCEITDEIFKDYEEYCERIILVNSMVWTCEMTGKNNLTYAEALESEKAAKKSLRDFPMELRIPILYLAAKTNRSSFAEMSEDVFNYVRERYFIGESVEACLEGDQWKEAHVLSVTAQKQQPGSKTIPPASSFVYEVEQFETDTDTGCVGTAPYDRVRRRKGTYTRDKNRLFLKQFVEHSAGLITIKKTALDKYNINKTNFDQIFTGNPPEFPSSKKLLNKTPPNTKRDSKPGSNKKSAKKPSPSKNQQSMDKFVKKTDKNANQAKSVNGTTKPKAAADQAAAKKSAQELAEKMRRAEDQMRQRKEEEKAKKKEKHARLQAYLKEWQKVKDDLELEDHKRKEEEKAKKKEKHARLQAYLKEWQKVKDDLELEDHKVIPKGTPIDIEGIPNKHFGDFLSVLEFVYVYADILKTKDTFHNELDLETFRKALTLKEYAGVFSDLIQMFLTTIFSLQEDEAEDYNEKGGIQESTGDPQVDTEGGMTRAVQLATKASKWPQTYLGTPLSKLPLDPTTVSEVLRLHLLSSGSAAGSRCVTWRYQQRGGYSSTDDAGIRLRVAHPHLLRKLHTAHVADLNLDDKFLILQCLMNQVLSYATVRDVIEEKLEQLKNTKHALRTLQINERKRENQLTVSKQELKKEFAAKKEELKLTGEKAKAHDEELKAAIEKLNKESEEKKAEFEKKLKELQTEVFDYASYVGTDRAYRRYWLNQRVAGLFVEAGQEPRGPCADKPVAPVSAARTDTLAYVTQLFEKEKEKAGSDKENDSAANSRGNTPKKPLANLNGINQKLNGLESNSKLLQELAVCTGDITTCFVHGKTDRPQWWVYHTEEQIEALIQSLNKRGYRESELRQALELDKANILEYLKKCPLHQLNPNAAPRGYRESDLRQALELDKANILEYLKKCPLHQLNPNAAPAPAVHHSTRNKKFQPSIVVPPDATLSEALELSLRDHILELEEKIFHGCLGALKVKDREAWRGTIMLRGYDKQAEYLTWGPAQQYRDDYHLPNGVLRVPNGIEKSDIENIPQNKYRDPGHYLETTKINGVKTEGVKTEPGVKTEADDPVRAAAPDVVRGLASALLQVSQAIHHKYIKRPLGLDDKERKDREARNKPLDLEALERWQVSLMECRSFSGVVLHLFTLDSSVSWCASILNASCRLCRRKADPDNMLLCDGCNKGHHLYCLKPKLTKVPPGDWFCEQCKPKERSPRKKRKLFSDDDIDETLNSEEESFSLDGAVCGACGSGGRLAQGCHTCSRRYHTECAAPAPARAAKRWTCTHCLLGTRDDSEDSDSNTPLVKLRGGRRSRASKEPSPVENGVSAKRGRKSKEESNKSTRKSKASLTNGHIVEEKPSKKRNSRVESSLHFEELDQLLHDIMKHKDCWPFYEPVSTEDVPDYLNVIETPMDFTTMRNKLEDRVYSTDEELLADAALVLTNCYTYNKDTHPVAKAGVRLERYIRKRCKELELPPFQEITLEADQHQELDSSTSQWDSAAKRRVAEHADAPRAKKPKLK